MTAKGVLDRTQKGVLRTYYYRPTDHPANQPFVNITDASVDSTDANGDSTHASGKSTDASVPEHTTLSVKPTVADTVDPSVAYVRNAPRTRTPTDHGFPEVVVDFNRKVVDLYVDAGVKDAQYAKYDYDDSDWLNGSEKLLSGMSALGLDERSRFDALKTIVNLVATSDRWKHHKRPRQLSEDWKDMFKDADTDHDATGDHSERRRNGRRQQPDSEDAKTTRRTRRHNSEGADNARPDTDRGDHEGPRARMQQLRAKPRGSSYRTQRDDGSCNRSATAVRRGSLSPDSQSSPGEPRQDNKAEANHIIGALREKRQEAATVGRVIQKRQNA